MCTKRGNKYTCVWFPWMHCVRTDTVNSPVTYPGWPEPWNVHVTGPYQCDCVTLPPGPRNTGSKCEERPSVSNFVLLRVSCNTALFFIFVRFIWCCLYCRPWLWELTPHCEWKGQSSGTTQWLRVLISSICLVCHNQSVTQSSGNDLLWGHPVSTAARWWLWWWGLVCSSLTRYLIS